MWKENLGKPIANLGTLTAVPSASGMSELQPQSHHMPYNQHSMTMAKTLAEVSHFPLQTQTAQGIPVSICLGSDFPQQHTGAISVPQTSHESKQFPKSPFFPGTQLFAAASFAVKNTA